MAPAPGGAQVDVSKETNPWRCAGRNPATGGAHGRGKSDVGLHADSGRPEESRAPGRAINDRAHLEGPRPVTSAEAPDIVANVSASALGSDRRGRFLYD